VVLDEAYCDYVDDPQYCGSIELAKEHENLLVLRTFSKVYGLAGLRVGYGIGPGDLLGEMHKLRTPFNTASVAQAAALAALDDSKHVRRSVAANAAGRAQLEKGLRALGAPFVPSATNFMFVETPGDGSAAAGQLLRLGVIVRPMQWMGFPSAIRVSVGLQSENEKFLQAFARACAHPASATRT
jgi:histidinol-phosphate aminotransferase